MVWSSARRPIASAPPSPLVDITCTGRDERAHVGEHVGHVAHRLGQRGRRLEHVVQDREALASKSSGGASPRPHATTLGNASVETSAHEVPIVKTVLMPLSVTRPDVLERDRLHAARGTASSRAGSSSRRGRDLLVAAHSAAPSWKKRRRPATPPSSAGARVVEHRAPRSPPRRRRRRARRTRSRRAAALGRPASASATSSVRWPRPVWCAWFTTSTTRALGEPLAHRLARERREQPHRDPGDARARASPP